MLTEVKIVDGLRELLIAPRPGIALATVDKGHPAIREDVEDSPDADGTDDYTERFGAAAVTLTLRLYQAGTTRALIDSLGMYCHPARRPWLVVSDDEWSTPRRVKLRADQLSKPIEAGKGPVREVQAAWKAPHGVWETRDPVALTVPVDIPSSVGRTYPRTHPWHYEPTAASGAQTTVNPGNTESHFTAKLYGPITAPSLVNTLTGQAITFSNALVLGAGEYVQIDTRVRTAFLLGDPFVGRLGHVDYPNTNWWQMQPGVQDLRYTGSDPSPGAVAEITYHPAWL